MDGKQCLQCVVMLLTLMGCGQRPQLLLIIDSDAPIPAQVSATAPATGELSPDAAIDSVRVDVIDRTGQVSEVCEFAAPNLSDWPLSFGVVRPAGEHGPVRVRVRGFHRRLASPDRLAGVRRVCGKELVNPDAVAVSEPLASVTIDRLLAVDPGETLQNVRVQLALDCMGAPPSFSEGTTCADANHRSAPLGEGLLSVSDRQAITSRVGTAAAARAVDCDPALRPRKGDTVCVRGGFTIMGDVRLAGIGDPRMDPLPLRAVLLSPFYMDRTEFTVQGWRDLLASGAKPPAEVIAKDPAQPYGQYCTFDKASDGRLPLNCVPYVSATFACATAGGALPTEAQWEHAARGRGMGWVFPWGNSSPLCCTASLGRTGPSMDVECSGAGMEPVASHPASRCAIIDSTPDGVVDLIGSVSEYLKDTFRPFQEGCGLTRGLTRDPECQEMQSPARSQRGSYWNASLLTGIVARRNLASVGPTNGFRCAYPGSKP